MKEVIILIIITGLTFFIFLLTLIFGFTKRNKRLKLMSLLALIVFIGLTSWTVYRFTTKSYKKIVNTLKPRTGDEIYNALFGERQSDCVRILNYQDQTVPKIDYAIWLHFETCPAELNRILSLHPYQGAKKSTKGWQTDGPSANEKWFKPESLGDSVLVFEHKKDEYGNGQTIYSSLDSNKVFCIDVAD